MEPDKPGAAEGDGPYKATTLVSLQCSTHSLLSVCKELFIYWVVEYFCFITEVVLYYIVAIATLQIARFI